MKMPGGEAAIVDLEKLTEYCLSVIVDLKQAGEREAVMRLARSADILT